MQNNRELIRPFLKRLENQRGGIQCLVYLEMKKKAIQSDFVRDLNIPAASINRALTMLIDEGLVVEESVKGHKRKFRLSTKGMKYGKIFSEINSEQPLIKPFSLSERAFVELITNEVDAGIKKDDIKLLEKNTEQGVVDFVYTDKNNYYVIVEMKNFSPESSDIEHIEAIKNKYKKYYDKLRIIYCAPEITADIKKRLHALEVEVKQIN